MSRRKSPRKSSKVPIQDGVGKTFWIEFYENPKYGRYAQKKKKEDKAGAKCATKAHSGSGVHSRHTCKSLSAV
jgi:hypothetical protein